MSEKIVYDEAKRDGLCQFELISHRVSRLLPSNTVWQRCCLCYGTSVCFISIHALTMQNFVKLQVLLYNMYTKTTAYEEGNYQVCCHQSIHPRYWVPSSYRSRFQLWSLHSHWLSSLLPSAFKIDLIDHKVCYSIALARLQSNVCCPMT